MPKMSRRPLFFEAQDFSIVARHPADFLRLVVVQVNHLLPRIFDSRPPFIGEKTLLRFDRLRGRATLNGRCPACQAQREYHRVALSDCLIYIQSLD